ncbi:MAG: peptidoglycan-binding domain-containing protein [Beijerinckiaceae bacterium]
MRRGVLAALLPLLLANVAFAQQPTPRPTPPPDPQLVAAQAAFEALPEAERRAIQMDLTFAAKFIGAAAGNFGQLTFNGIKAFETANRLGVDGILQPPERQALALQAGQRRQALKFALVDDARSSVRIGVPQAVLPKREPAPAGGTRFQSADGRVTLETLAIAPPDTLQALYDRAVGPGPAGRKVTYKLLRPEFFVVSGETEKGKFYRRIALGADGKLRGFAIGYDKAVAVDIDQLVIAIANSFEPFPTAVAQQVRPPVAAVAAVAAPTPAPAERLGTGLIVGAGRVLTASAAVKGCKAVLAGPRRAAARIVASDAGAGLSLLAVEGVQGAMPPAGTAGEGPLTILSQAWNGAVATDLFSEASAIAGGRIAAPLQPGGAGAVLFDAKGALAGIVTDDPAAARKVAGVVPLARYRLAEAGAVSAFLGVQGLSATAVAAAPGPVAAARRGSILPLFCQP